jgi:hypothetical protein
MHYYDFFITLLQNQSLFCFTNKDKVTSISFKFTFLIFGFSVVVLPIFRPKISHLPI